VVVNWRSAIRRLVPYMHTNGEHIPLAGMQISLPLSHIDAIPSPFQLQLRDRFTRITRDPTNSRPK